MLHHLLKHSKTRKMGPNSDTRTRVTTEPTPISLTPYSASTPTLGLSNERQPELELEVEEVRVRVRVKLQLQHAQQGTAMTVLAAFETRRRGRLDAVSMAVMNTIRATAVGDREICCRGGSVKKTRKGRGTDCVRWRVLVRVVVDARCEVVLSHPVACHHPSPGQAAVRSSRFPAPAASGGRAWQGSRIPGRPLKSQQLSACQDHNLELMDT